MELISRLPTLTGRFILLSVIFLLAIVLTAIFLPTKAYADEPVHGGTIQHRFAIKRGSAFLHLTGTTHLRNDLYDSFGFGLDTGYYWRENWGAELRLLRLQTKLSNAAIDIKDKTGLTPDARAQDYMMMAGLRYSIGYGKIQTFDRFIVHFDPQWTFHGGTAFAEGRLIPTVTTGLSLLNHFRYGIQVKIDLAMTSQLERRDRGWVASFGFSPFLGVGFARTLGGGQ